jgi:DGQHR domain-containing protein
MEQRRYFGCLIQQRLNNDVVRFFIFQARVKDIRKWAGIRRVQDFPEGTQRVFRKTRVRKITRFLESDPINTIPNNLLLAFNPGQTTFTSMDSTIKQLFPDEDLLNNCDGLVDWGFLDFSFEPDRAEHLRPALIVDGQHRLFGMSNFETEDLPVTVVSLVEATLQEQAFQFIVVNNKAVRVATTTAKSIIADIDVNEDVLQERLLTAGIAYGDMSPTLRDIDDLPTSPFYKLLRWERNREGIQLVPLTAIEQSLRFLRATFANYLEEDEDSLVEIFLAIWRAIKECYPDLWGKDNKFMTKVNINALNEFIVKRLKSASEFGLVDIFDVEDVKRMVLTILDNIPKEFWERDWSIKIQDNTNVREQIQDDLGTIVDNYKLQKRWTEGLSLPLLEM